MSTSKTRSGIAILYILLSLKFSVSVKNGWTGLEIAEVNSADEEAAIIPEWHRYMCDRVRDYRTVIELLRGNLVEPVTLPTHHVSPQNIPYNVCKCCLVDLCALLYSATFRCKRSGERLRSW